MKTIAAWAAMIMGTVLLTAPAFADRPIVCVPADAWTETIQHAEVSHEETVTVVDEAHWQRYSWTGGPHESNDAPAFPSEDWQPNVKGDPHNIGQEGAYFVSRGNSGNGDWFYLEWVEEETHEETTTVIDEEAWTETVEHPAVVCEGEEVTDPEPNPDVPDDKTPNEATNQKNPVVHTPAKKNAPVPVPTAVDAGL